jgi:putative FmdB family regulatory protein
VPTYQYVCTSCGEDLEAVQSFTDAALTDCPACDGQLRKRYSAVGVVFKGSGFYKTDSRSSGRSGNGEKREKAEKSTASADSSSDSSSTATAKESTSTSNSSDKSSTSTPAPAASSSSSSSSAA